MTTLFNVRMTATDALPTFAANNNCVQDARSRLRAVLAEVDATGSYAEADEAPTYLIQARDNLWAWIKEASPRAT